MYIAQQLVSEFRESQEQTETFANLTSAATSASGDDSAGSGEGVFCDCKSDFGVWTFSFETSLAFTFFCDIFVLKCMVMYLMAPRLLYLYITNVHCNLRSVSNQTHTHTYTLLPHL